MINIFQKQKFNNKHCNFHCFYWSFLFTFLVKKWLIVPTLEERAELLPWVFLFSQKGCRVFFQSVFDFYSGTLYQFFIDHPKECFSEFKLS